MLQLYEYKTCSTCQKAIKYLDSMGVEYDRIPIVDHPPGVEELQRMLSYLSADGGGFKSLFNTSGQLYRELGIAEKLRAGMTSDEALALLSKNGKLIKRPFALGARAGAVGFNPDVWAKLVPLWARA